MSRIGKMPVVIPKNVQVAVDEKNNVSVQGPKGKLTQSVPLEASITQIDGQLLVSYEGNHRSYKAKHGLTRALINNMVIGVTEGFSRKLIIEGVGYKASINGKNLVLSLGYSHQIDFPPPEGIEFGVDKTGTQLTVSGLDKSVVGETASQIRRLRKPEPYKGKGVRYSDEVIRRKAGKTGKSKK